MKSTSAAAGARILRLYQRTVSPDHGWLRVFYPRGFCRFHPTCSEYGRLAVGRYGVRRGLVLALWRVGRCHPWSAGGYDPVPEKSKIPSTSCQRQIRLRRKISNNTK